MTEQLQRAVQFANPLTGEILTLDAPDEDLGRYLSDIREYESVIREHKSMVGREILERMQKRAKFTINAGGWKLTAPSPKPQEVWDGAELREALLAFVDAGILSVEAVDAAVSTEVTYKVHALGVRSLRSLGGEIAAAVDRLATEVEKARYVSVKRA